MIVLNKQTQTQTQTLSPNLFYLEKRNQEELVSSDILLPVNLNIIIHAINFDTIENMNKMQSPDLQHGTIFHHSYTPRCFDV